MASESTVREIMARLDWPPFSAAIEFCGGDAEPGRDDIPERRDWTVWGTTPDQRQIEACLAGMIGPASTILHVGVGNSSLARRFASGVTAIHGITISPAEKSLADSLRLPNYTVSLINKFTDEIEHINAGSFDVIVENNPSSFACCRFHFCRMLGNYVDLLGDEGEIVTAEAGLNWVAPGGDPAWSLTWRDWVQLGEALRLRARRITHTVYSLQRPPGATTWRNDEKRPDQRVMQPVSGDGEPAGGRSADCAVEWAELVMQQRDWRDHAAYNRDCDAAFAQLQPMTALRPFTTDTPTVICVARNEERRLPEFIDHYKRLGVGCLHIVDNASDDRTAEICIADRHVTLWRTEASYRAANYGQLWVGALARRFGLGKWVLNVDADELFVYAGMASHGAGDLQRWLIRQGHCRVFAPMIDMYGSRSYGSQSPTDRRPLLLQTPFFDGGCKDGRPSYEFRKTPYGPLLAGGPRNRILSTDDDKKFHLSKFPLTLWTAETAYANPHFPYPFADNPEAPLAALLHFKFLADFEPRVAAAIDEGEHWRDAAEYREYRRWIGEGGGPAAVFSNAFSRIYRGPESLVAAGLLRQIEW